jgi:hypothetical protein
MTRLLVAPLALMVLSAACSGAAGEVIEGTGQGAIGPQRIENATEVLKFDPAAIAPGDFNPVPGGCLESAVVPGSYRCELELDGPVEPCFALNGERLLCNPDPVDGAFNVLVRPANALPPVAPPSPDRAVVFFVELDGGLTCAIRAGPEPVIIGGAAASYDCDAPFTYLVGEGMATFNREAPLWAAAVHTLDPATGQSSGAPANVRRAWIP